jgi:hypothetical protein
MTIRNVTKNLIGMEDLLAGVGKTDQVRNETTYSMGRIDVPYAVSSVAEMQALDVTRFINARVYSTTTDFTDYRYDPTDVTGILPVAGSGSWILILSKTTPITLAEAIASTTLFDGATVTISDRNYANFDVVLASTVSPNTYDVIQCTGIPELALVLRIKEELDIKDIGATTDADIYPYVLHALTSLAGTKPVRITDNYTCDTGIQIDVTGSSLLGIGRGSCGITFGPTVDVGIFGNPAASSINHVTIAGLRLKTAKASARTVDYSRFSYSFIENNIIEISKANSVCCYGAGDNSGASPYYNVIKGNYLAATGSGFQNGGTGYLFYPGGTVNRGPNAMKVSGGRVSGMERSVYIEAGNNIEVSSVWSESCTNAHYVVGSETADVTGTATSGAKSSLTDSGASFGTLSFAGIRITAGTGAGQDRKVINTVGGITINIEGAWQTIPDATSQYEVYDRRVLDVKLESCRAESSAGSTVIRRMPGPTKVDIGAMHISTVSSLIEPSVYDFQDRIYASAFGGLQKTQWFRENLAANLTNSKLTLGAGPFTETYLARNIIILAISVKLTINCSAGSATFTPEFNGIALTDAAVTINTVSNNNMYVPFGYGGPQSGGAREFGVRVDTTADFASTSTDVVVEVIYCTR